MAFLKLDHARFTSRHDHATDAFRAIDGSVRDAIVCILVVDVEALFV